MIKLIKLKIYRTYKNVWKSIKIIKFLFCNTVPMHMHWEQSFLRQFLHFIHQILPIRHFLLYHSFLLILEHTLDYPSLKNFYILHLLTFLILQSFLLNYIFVHSILSLSMEMILALYLCSYSHLITLSFETNKSKI